MAYFPTATTSIITYPAGPTTTGVQVITPVAPNTKGSYAEIAASLTVTTTAITVNVNEVAGGSGLQTLFDIATGAAGSETVVVPDLATDQSETRGIFVAGPLPIEIPVGTRVACRGQCSGAGTLSMRVCVTCISAGGMRGLTSLTAYGIDAATSGGTSIDPGGTANTKGSYTAITASTSNLTQWMMAVFTGGGEATRGLISNIWAVDIATGAGGAETVLWSDLRTCTRVMVINADAVTGRQQGYLTYIPASTRIAARCSCSINTAGDRLMDVTLQAGGPAPAIGGPWIYYEQQHNQSGGF